MPVQSFVDPDTVHNPSSGGIAPATWFTTHEANFRSITGRVGARIYRINAQAFGTAPFSTTVTLDTVDFNNGMTTSTANTIIVPTSYGGKYLLNAGLQCSFANGAGNSVPAIDIKVNGTSVFTEQGSLSTGTHYHSLAATTVQSLAVADAITMTITTTGAFPTSLQTEVGSVYPSLSALWLSA